MRRVCAVPDVSDLKKRVVYFFSCKYRRTLKRMLLCSLLEWGRQVYCAHVSNHVADGMAALLLMALGMGPTDADGGESERERYTLARSLAFRN